MDKRALGKGLSALIPEKSESQKSDTVTYLKLDEISNSRFQPRTNYDQEKLAELKNSIKEKGVLQPILVREKNGGYEVIAGERRLRAARELAFDDVPVIVKNVSDQEALVLALVENIQREELNPVEEAEAFRKLIEDFQFTQESVAQSVGKDRSTVSNILRLLKLPADIKQSLYEGKITLGHGRALVGLDSTTEQKRLFLLTLKKELSVRELENLIKAQSTVSVRRSKNKDGKSQQVVTLENGLQKILGTKVRIDTKNKRGKIVIDFYSPQDLERIVKIIIKT